MPPDLSSYLASRYLVADPKPSSKKRKRKQALSTGLLISDDSDPTWTQGRTDGLEDENDNPTIVGSTTVEGRSSKKSGWKRVGGARNAAAAGTSEEAAADAILAAAAAENEAARANDDDAPVVEGGEDVVKMSDGTHAGLQTAASVSAQLKKRQREEQEDFERHRKEGKEQETVYRDATGRRIDVSMRRAELRKIAAEAELKELKAKEDLKGAVQLEEARARREKLQAAKFMTVARSAADVEMNEELKARQRWNDPMAQFLPKEEPRGKGKGRASKLKPVYSGAAPPNRYGIKPGYRWDGVDRGNGFEAKRFKAINRRERNKNLAYSWQMDE